MDLLKGVKRFVMPSTRRFWREADLENLPWGERLHAYVYGRWPYFYISVATGENRLARVFTPVLDWLGKRLNLWADSSRDLNKGMKKSFADSYHGKVVSLDGAKQLIRLDREVELRDLEQVIPYTTAKDIVIKNPKAIAVLRCPCRVSRKNPCHPVDVCIIIGEPFASFIVEHHPGRAKWVTYQEALEILSAEDRRGHVHHAFFKEAMLGRFYAICNCCSCCCGAMQARKNGVPMLASSGYVSRIRPEECSGCGFCMRSCQFGAICLEEGVAVVDEEKCMGCGVCVNNCPQGALNLVHDPQKGQPLDVQDLMDKHFSELVHRDG